MNIEFEPVNVEVVVENGELLIDIRRSYTCSTKLHLQNDMPGAHSHHGCVYLGLNAECTQYLEPCDIGNC